MYISKIVNSKKLVKVKVIINKEIKWISKKLVKINNKEINMYTKACKACK